MKLVNVRCCICGADNSIPVATGEDYEYHTTDTSFSMHRCLACDLLYLNPRPDMSEFTRIYPPTYHSLDFSRESFGFVHDVRSRLEARRLLRYCEGAPAHARILDVGCGDGFHLKLLREYGNSDWTLEGVDVDERAVQAALAEGLTIRVGDLEELALPAGSYDVVYMIQTIEHVAGPGAILREILRILKPGGRLVIVTDNANSVDAKLFRRKHWGGYHFPRHWNLFNRSSMRKLAETTGFICEEIATIVTPVNWVYSIRNRLVDRSAPEWLVERFSLKSPVSLAAGTVADSIFQLLGNGGLLNAYLRKPE